MKELVAHPNYYTAGALGRALKLHEMTGAPELVKAANTGDLKLVEELLVSRQLHPDIRWKGDMTPLHYAVQNQFPDVVRVLFRHDANPNLQNSSGWSALHMAVARESHEMVTLLLDSGADPGIRDDRGLQPKDWVLTCETGPDEELLRLLTREKGMSLVSLLLPVSSRVLSRRVRPYSTTFSVAY